MYGLNKVCFSLKRLYQGCKRCRLGCLESVLIYNGLHKLYDIRAEISRIGFGVSVDILHIQAST